MRKLVYILFFAPLFSTGQDLFPLVKGGKINLDTVNLDKIGFKTLYIDSLTGDTIYETSKEEVSFVKIELILRQHPNYRKAILNNVNIPYFGKTIIANSLNDDGVDVYGGSTVCTTNQGIDTLIINGQFYYEINPFPNVFIVNEKINMDSLDVYHIKHSGEPHYTFHNDRTLASACIINNEYGSVKLYWDEQGRKTKEGAFLKNKRNGPWKFYNRKGKLVGTQYYENGVVIKTEGKIRW